MLMPIAGQEFEPLPIAGWRAVREAHAGGRRPGHRPGCHSDALPTRGWRGIRTSTSAAGTRLPALAESRPACTWRRNQASWSAASYQQYQVLVDVSRFSYSAAVAILSQAERCQQERAAGPIPPSHVFSFMSGMEPPCGLFCCHDVYQEYD